MTLLFYVLSAFGFCYAVGHARVSLAARLFMARRFEALVVLLECPACLGFWVGLVVGAVDSTLVPFALPLPLAALALAFFTSGVNYILGRLTGWIQEG